MKQFLQEVAERVLALQQEHKQLRVVLPNQRSGLFLKQEISKLIKKPIFLPKIDSIQNYFFELSGLQPVEQTEQLLRLYESHIATAKKPENFDSFLRWGTTFLSDCSEIDTNLIDTDRFFELLYSDREIRNWNLSIGLTSMQEEYLEFWKVAKDLYNHFTENLIANNKAYNGLAYRYVCEQLTERNILNSNEYVVFVGFNALNKAEEFLFDYCYKTEQGEFLWDVDEYYLNDANNKAGQYFRDYKTRWQNQSLEQPPRKIGKNTESIQVLQSPNFTAQVDIAIQVLQDLQEQEKINGRNTAIILGDESLLEPLLYRLPKDLTYNITMGKSVSSFSLYFLFENYLRLLSLYNQEDGGFPTSILSIVIASPFLEKLDCPENPALEQLRKYILDNNVAYINLETIQSELKNEKLAKLFEEPKEITSVLNQLDWLVEQLRNEYDEEKIQKQVLFELKKIFTQFKNFFEQYPIPTTIQAFKGLFRSVASATKIPYEGEPLVGVQIIGVLETRGLDFENLIVLDCNEGTLPKGRSGTSFIPFVFKDYFNIQTFKDKDAIYAYSFYRLLHTPKQMFFIYNGQSGATNAGEQSRFITQIEAEFRAKTDSNIEIVRKNCTFNSIIEDTEKEEYRIEKTPEILAQIENFLQTKSLSPSSLNTLINSPLDFYFSKILRLQETDQLEEELADNTIGTIVHRVLEKLYSSIVHQPLTKEFLTGIKNKIEPTVLEIFDEVFKKGNTASGLNYLMKKAANELVLQTIETDIKRLRHHKIEIIALEENLKSTLNFTVDNRTYRVRLVGNADRIQKRDDVIEIIDYKSGKVNQAKLKSKDVAKISTNTELSKLNQLMCYILMATEGETKIPLDKIVAGMQPLKSWNDQIIFLDNKNDSRISQEVLETYKDEIISVLNDLLNPEIPFTVIDEDRLTYSPYKNIIL